MSVKIEKAAAEREPLAVETLEHLTRLEAVVDRYRQQTPPDPAEIQSALDPLVRLAAALRDEYAGYQQAFAPLLDRFAALDVDALETFHGFGQISPVPRRARELKRAIAAALEDLDDVLNQWAAFGDGKRSDVQLREIRGLVPRLEMDLWRLPDELRFFHSRVGNFEAEEPAPPGITVTGPIERH